MALLLVVLVAALAPVAYADPPDPSWIGGLWDDDDFDNVVVFLLSTYAVVTSALLHGGALGNTVAILPCPEPRLGDTPYLNKPPLVAWLIALVSWPAGGVTQSTAIWPSLAAALGIVLVTWWIGRRLWDQAVGLTAGFVVLTMHGVFTQARTAM